MEENNTSLTVLREQIDSIDDEIITLLKQRTDIVKQVGKIKHSQQGTRRNFIRSGREASMLRNLVKRTSNFPPEAIAIIWRVIISASLAVEQNMQIWCLASAEDNYCYWLAREYYGSFANIKKSNNSETIIAKVLEHPEFVGILPLIDNTEHPWWIRPDNEKNDLYIFAKIPFIEKKAAPAIPVFAVASVIPEKTNEDASVFSLTCKAKHTEIEKTFAKYGYKINVLAKKDNYYLIETDHFLRPQDDVVAQIKADLTTNAEVASLRLLGNYAIPIKI